MTDRYLRIVLTIIALELGWIALEDVATPIAAQNRATDVVITGVRMDAPASFLPVGIVGGVSGVAPQTGLRVEPLQTHTRIEGTLDVRTIEPVTINNQRPIVVQNIQAPGARVPGE